MPFRFLPSEGVRCKLLTKKTASAYGTPFKGKRLRLRKLEKSASRTATKERRDREGRSRKARPRSDHKQLVHRIRISEGDAITEVNPEVRSGAGRGGSTGGGSSSSSSVAAADAGAAGAAGGSREERSALWAQSRRQGATFRLEVSEHSADATTTSTVQRAM